MRARCGVVARWRGIDDVHRLSQIIAVAAFMAHHFCPCGSLYVSPGSGICPDACHVRRAIEAWQDGYRRWVEGQLRERAEQEAFSELHDRGDCASGVEALYLFGVTRGEA